MDDSPRYSARSSLRLALLALTLMFSLTVAASEIIYTWTDDQGVRHFSSQPPEGLPYRVVQVSGQSQAPAAEPTQPAPDSPMPALSEISQTAPDPELVRERCLQARQNLDLLQQDRPAMLQNEEGEPVPLDDEARQRMIEETQDFIDQWC